ncbi:DUF885 domain-containing protein [Sorangium sp. So ce1036]
MLGHRDPRPLARERPRGEDCLRRARLTGGGCGPTSRLGELHGQRRPDRVSPSAGAAPATLALAGARARAPPCPCERSASSPSFPWSQELAAAVARARGLSSSDYRDVIRALKEEQLVGEAILPHYKERLAQIEAILRRERLVTLPERPARIRLGTAAESAETPAPHMRPPRLLDNRGEEGEFVLPLSLPAPPGAAPDAQQKTDDFTHAAASWTLTAHEARPGHELQFASLVERGVSVARAVFAMNSANVEGWGLYAEAILLPFMPPEGQLVSLQFRLLRAARAFLDPELQAGKITPAAARALLTQDVALSAPFAQSEVERYTFRAPGQATSYFYGFTRLMELRREVESTMGARFDAQRFHDFVLAQGILPPKLLRKAVLERFVRAQPAP